MTLLTLGALPLVSIVMRTVGGRPREIRRALHSLAANAWRPLEVIIVYQGGDNENWSEIQQLPSEIPTLPMRLVRNSGNGDRRAENLNIGWESAQGRYLGFLDDDDTLEPNHINLLVEAMESTGRSWAYAQVVLRREDEELNIVSETKPFIRHAFSLKSLWTENFLPIHCFLVDRTMLNETMRVRPFHEGLDRSEDWDFLLRLAFWHEPATVDKFSATYHVSTGSRNTNISLMSEDTNKERERLNREAWARCRAIVEERKTALALSVWWAHDFFDIKPATPEILAGANESGSTALFTRSFKKRVVRKLIRFLERML